jgi:hypothetical protein
MYPFTLLATSEIHSDKAGILVTGIVVEETEPLNMAAERRRQLQRNMEQQMRNFASSLPHLPQPDQQRMLVVIERMEKVLAHLRAGDAS